MIGRAVMRQCVALGHEAIAGVRSASADFERQRITGNLEDEDVDWVPVVRDMRAVIHISGLAHAVVSDPEYLKRVNVDATRRIAAACARAGVRRLVLLSTVKVNGDSTDLRPFSEADLPSPGDPYARSKLEAELAAREVEAATGLEVTVVRSPLVYGEGVKANFLALMRAVDRGLPLPFASLTNERSIIYADNLANLLVRCADAPAAGGLIFVANEGPPLSTPALIRAIASALDRPARLFPLPPVVLRALLRIVGGNGLAERLTSSLVVDGTLARERLSWRPVVPFDDAIAKTAEWYRHQRSTA
jgi:UDP-glucose 4-epimerase